MNMDTKSLGYIPSDKADLVTHSSSLDGKAVKGMWQRRVQGMASSSRGQGTENTVHNTQSTEPTAERSACPAYSNVQTVWIHSLALLLVV